jgi:hypothetical protein
VYVAGLNDTAVVFINDAQQFPVQPTMATTTFPYFDQLTYNYTFETSRYLVDNTYYQKGLFTANFTTFTGTAQTKTLYRYTAPGKRGRRNL